MAKREALRELQSRLADRLQHARTEERALSFLAVECAGQGLLFPLSTAGEIFAVGTLLPVPPSMRLNNRPITVSRFTPTFFRPCFHRICESARCASRSG